MKITRTYGNFGDVGVIVQCRIVNEVSIWLIKRDELEPTNLNKATLWLQLK